jgi:hypothetical protein
MKTAHFLKLDKTTSQDLSAGALSYTTNYSRKFKLEQIMCHASAAISETIKITLDSAKGSNYDAVLQEVVLVAETDFIYRPQGEANFQAGDEIKIECTNANLTGIIYVLIKASEM